ncbi:hypothetical protein HMPREF1624_05104 [Sporothrix schenckii ATCC 58251]|uniref:Major facilitator superfamily (MFS) profile domain-containing protein n=1 Tax=Sporothrix schenckii (strain ATCC 58251 / de Perez 2211183) TaxID=1391915 RepID=U7PV07_SPOS1|nr:hypothetical protein HMPREF1624_05104 [Sporothrix schenckii ATCC 58251]
MSDLQHELHRQQRRRSWYRSPLFSVVMVACTAFTCPGIFGALNGMGAGGGASAGTSNAANAIVFGILAVVSPFVGIFCNYLTPKWTLFIGTFGYAPYAAGFYVVDHYGESWLLLFGAVTCGLSACFLWVASGSIIMGYPEENRKGLAASLKFSFQNLGASIGGIISLALNAEKAYRGSISEATYVALMTIMCLGFPFALNVSPAHRVQRRDNLPVVLRKAPTLAMTFRILWTLIKTPTVLGLMPFMIYSQWFLSYQWQFNFAYFTVRTRALNSMLFYLGGLVAALSFGQLLDWTRFHRTTRARIGFFVVSITSGTSWIIGQAVQHHYMTNPPTLDWVEARYGLPCFLFLLWGISDPLCTVYMYWLTGSLTNNVNESALLTGIINSLGSVGSTFGFVVSAMDFNYDGACAINLALFFLSLPGLSWVAFKKVTETSHGADLTAIGQDAAGGSNASLQDGSSNDGAQEAVVVSEKAVEA